MKYLLMIYGNEEVDAQKSKEALEAEMGAYFAYTNEVETAGALRGGEALHPTSTATTVRVRNGKISTTDGPFAETKEQLGGYYVVECSNLDEAIKWAAKIPHAAECAVEVRPIMDFSQAAPA
ncbi:MAG TPA: YciI family protein [Bryobacteraceae bacterium]|nr:YciI family protein [Bryobacteraceae bacterium]